MPFELRCERRLWRAFARFGARPVDPMDQPLPRATKGCLVALFVVVVIVPMPVVALELSRDPDFSWGRVVAWSAVVVIALVALLVMRMLGTSWWMNGAGEPVLALRDGVVRGRLSPASRGAEPYQGWDFELPVKNLAGVRLTPSGVLVLEVPEEVADRLRDTARTSVHAQHWERTVDSPTAWPGKMLRTADRTERLSQIVAELNGQRSSGPAT
ncbi:hypothetical protein [Nocardioides jensenii]|uniref:hypothetical protein n=1 Tax=Nocardioides jensenii TaxID=1843 RepID=UPI000833DFAA|nr:hypothetical protein [Nocardioides jensenii]